MTSDEVKKIKYLGRGIHKEKFVESLKNGNLKQMLQVINNDVELDLQIRNDYLNIYYRGGNIAKVKSESSVEFDKYYFYLDMKNTSKNVIKLNPMVVAELKLKRNLLIDKFKNHEYRDYFNLAKTVMDKWLKINPNPERMEQHQLSVENKYKKSDYTIIDLEYQVSTESDFACKFIAKGKADHKNPRFDIIAINKQGKLCVIELKKGTGALTNTSGLKEHWDCYRESIGRNHKPFMKEMENLLKQKQAFGLIDKQLKIEYPLPEFMFAYSYDDKTSEEDQDIVFRDECNKIGIAIQSIILAKGTLKLLDA
jgi:hypothetical protein